MLTFKFFVFIGIVYSFVDSIKNVKEEKTTKNKIYLAITIAFLIFGIYMLYDAFV